MAVARRNARIAWALPLVFAASLAGAARAQSSPDRLTPREASRFLAQATFGADANEIERTAEIGLDAWLDEQFDRPVGYHQPYLDERQNLALEVTAATRRWAWWQQVMNGPDALRQRVALALSEIFVVSDVDSTIGDNPIGLANYYDTLLDDAFGNYRDLLLDVSLHPIMGVYLSHLRNERSDPSRGRFPDENYAREIMQLFSIGLFELNPDGTLQLDGSGEPIPTYDNDDITEFAKIFTGLSFSSPTADFHGGDAVWTRPMRMYDAYHEPGPKYLLRGRYVPPGQSGMQDVQDAIDNLFHHPNVGPFFARRLIQRLVTSNPSPQYIRRVAMIFQNNGQGVRGDMRAVIRAVLLDPEARTWPTSINAINGRLCESFLRRVQLARVFHAKSPARIYPIDDPGAPVDFGQRPLSSPSVFNFFLPDYQPTGPITDFGLFAPEFQIITAVTAIASADQLQTQIESGMNFDDNDFNEVRLDLSDEIALAPNVPALIDHLDLLLTYGNMSGRMRQILVQALEQLDDPEVRAQMAVYLIAISPEFAVVQ
jgi:uncharacterized protein (DUF1800 family)